jgi:hypothetical protein
MADEHKKPKGMSWQSWSDALYSRAQAEGAFENLPGAGKPIPGLEGNYDENWWLRQKLKREDLTIVPETTVFKRQLPEELERIGRMRYESQVREKLKELNAQIRELNTSAGSGPPLNLSEFDVEAAVAKWRETQT